MSKRNHQHRPDKQCGKLKRWLLRRLGGVSRSDYDIVTEQRDNFIGDLRINESLIKNLEAENELLKKQIAHDPITPVTIKIQNVKLKEIKKSRRSVRCR